MACLVTTLALVGSACSVSGGGATSDTVIETSPPDPKPATTKAGDRFAFAPTAAFEPTECFPTPETGPAALADLACGYVTVPADYGRYGVETFRLATVFVDNGVDAPPVVFLPGGPGGSAASIAPALAGAPFNVIAFDERGIGFSEPSLDCVEVNDLFHDIVTKPVRDTLQPYGDALAACRARLANAGIRFDVFDSAHSARDIGVVHRAAGVRRGHPARRVLRHPACPHQGEG